jgi:phosphonate transport system permease protein
MTMTATAPIDAPSLTETVTRAFDRKRRLAFAVPAAIIAYLLYAAISFDVMGLASRALVEGDLSAEAVTAQTRALYENLKPL